MIAAARRFIERRGFLFAYACVFVVLIARGWGRLTHAEIWAEDGADFLHYALEMGAASFFVPLDGSFHVLQRILMLLIVKLVSVEGWPLAISLTYVAIYSAIAASWMRRDYEWLLPERGQRFILCGLFAIAPGLGEMYGNLPNINWPLFIWVGMVGLKDFRVPIRSWEVALSLLIITSIGVSVFLLPLFALRFWERRKQGVKSWLTPETVIIGFVVAWMALVASVEIKRSRRAMPSVAQGVNLLSGLVSRNIVFRPWLGFSLTRQLIEPAHAFAHFVVSLFAVGAVGWGLWKLRRDRAVQALLAFGFGVILWPVAAWYARAGGTATFTREMFGPFLDHRYSYAYGIFALMFWPVFLFKIPLGRRARAALFVYWLCAQPSIAMIQRKLPRQGAEPRWPVHAPTLRKSLETGCPGTVRIPIYPDPWFLNYRSPSPTC